MFYINDLHLSYLISLAYRIPEFNIFCPICVVLPPGQAAISNIVSCIHGFNAMTGTNELAY